ncbi:O-antigen ligase family protein [Sphingorhabdus contaminans]|uniref:O-antigen ligase family protein n=1 Tax=Sphingorhabdus contaminans TaxID=1343899 RepID=A0A553WBK1_9SPHN|nr:O-antigen ligase family protein [Sphingorhabdus contaminans]TSB02032.1 O-antigen ligase family protein [Sphingorhabdus contaminans]
MGLFVESFFSKDIKAVLSQPWFVAVLLITMAPGLHAIATWDLDGRLSSTAYAVRHYSYMVVLVEILVIWLALRNDLSFSNTFWELPKRVRTLLALWLTFSLIALFSTMSGLSNALFTLVRYLTHGFFLVSLVHLLSKSNRFDIQISLKVLSAGAVVYVVLLAIFCILVPNPQDFPWVRRVPSATNIRQIGNNVGLLAIAPVALLMASKRRSCVGPTIAFVIILSFATWTGSRATLLGLFFGIACGLVIVRHFTTLRNMASAAVAAVMSILISVAMPVPDPTFGLFRLVKASGEQDDPSSGRWELWAQTWEQITQSPWIGHGAGRYRDDMNLHFGTTWNHPHNFILQYLYDWGFVGGSIALILLAILGVAILRRTKADPLSRFIAITAYCAICATAMIDSPLFHPLPIMIALTLIAPVFAIAKESL